MTVDCILKAILKLSKEDACKLAAELARPMLLTDESGKTFQGGAIESNLAGLTGHEFFIFSKKGFFGQLGSAVDIKSELEFIRLRPLAKTAESIKRKKSADTLELVQLIDERRKTMTVDEAISDLRRLKKWKEREPGSMRNMYYLNRKIIGDGDRQ